MPSYALVLCRRCVGNFHWWRAGLPGAGRGLDLCELAAAKDRGGYVPARKIRARPKFRPTRICTRRLWNRPGRLQI